MFTHRSLIDDAKWRAADAADQKATADAIFARIRELDARNESRRFPKPG